MHMKHVDVGLGGVGPNMSQAFVLPRHIPAQSPIALSDQTISHPREIIRLDKNRLGVCRLFVLDLLTRLLKFARKDGNGRSISTP